MTLFLVSFDGIHADPKCQHFLSQRAISETPEVSFELIKRIEQMTGNTLFLLLRRCWKRESASVPNRRIEKEGKGERRRGVGATKYESGNGDYVRREGGSKIGTKKGNRQT